MKSIRRRLTRELLAVSLILLLGGWVAFFFAARHELVEQLDATLRARALTLTTLTVWERGHLQLEAADRVGREFGLARPREFFEVWDAAGQVLLRSESLAGADLTPPPAAGRRVSWNAELPHGRRVRAMALDFQPRQAVSESGLPPGAEVRLAVATTRQELDEALTELLALAGLGGLLLLGAVLWGVPRVLRRGLRPLDAMAERVAGIQVDSLAWRFEAFEVPQELAPIAHRLNELLGRLEASFERERQFSADLAHELRTPIAELRSLAECALKWPESREPSTDRDVLASAQHMETLVTQLLALARGEQGQVQATLAEHRLDEAVQVAWAPFAERAAHRALQLRFDLPAVTAEVDPFLLRSILRNLLDNAVDHAPTGSELTVSLEAVDNGTRLRVANAAPALEAADVPRLFDRFWRKEAARSGQQHLGLGLTLARAYARAMGWTLSAAHDSSSGWLVFTLERAGEHQAGRSGP